MCQSISVRMAEWSKAPDSRLIPCFLIGSGHEISGPRMRAWVRTPFLTKTSLFVSSFFPFLHILKT